jgi:hypothetical protein
MTTRDPDDPAASGSDHSDLVGSGYGPLQPQRRWR